MKAYLEIARPFSLTASLVPVLLAGALADQAGRFDLVLFVLTLVANLSLQAGTNVVNEIYDVRTGADTPASPRASKALIARRLTVRGAAAFAVLLLALTGAIGLYLVSLRGLPMLVIGLVGIAAGYSYTGPPFAYKYHALGVPVVFLLMGPVMVAGAFLAITGELSATAIAAAIPIGLLVAAILHANDVRDIGEDAAAGVVTLSTLLDRPRATRLYTAMMASAFVVTPILVALRGIPPFGLAALATIPLAVGCVRTMEHAAATGDLSAIARIDQRTAQVHLLFGLALALAITISAAIAAL